ncbi:hypothetical protein GCM10023085_67920 [Actinomadura viridis]|uniref:DUF6896 domain-containing protein n=1 Tax=Actinomadura viridis TaxID=58110 RepID=A0A931DGF2_9ACTN|nr:hypothetical protein [Actinomadura viridis]MBG6088329.1 hypothetical protein [Actinomadura viridis]
MTLSGIPSDAELRRSVTRGRHAVIPLEAGPSWEEVTAAAAALQERLAADDLIVFNSGSGDGRPRLTVVRVVGTEEARRLRPALDALVADFRSLAERLSERFRLEIEPASDRGETYPRRLVVDGEPWQADPHGVHCRFESLESGVVVEAHNRRPGTLDPYFLLLFAETSGRHPEVLSACVEGFHDMSRLLDLAGLTP